MVRYTGLENLINLFYACSIYSAFISLYFIFFAIPDIPRSIGVISSVLLTVYIISSRTAHRIVGYFEEEAVISYTDYLNELENGKIEDQPAPEIAINYWNLPLHSTLKDVVRVIRDDEAGHRDLNHKFANILDERKKQNSYKNLEERNTLNKNKNKN